MPPFEHASTQQEHFDDQPVVKPSTNTTRKSGSSPKSKKRLSPSQKPEDQEIASFLVSLKHSTRSVSPEPSDSSIENHTPPLTHRPATSYPPFGGAVLSTTGPPVMPYTSSYLAHNHQHPSHEYRHQHPPPPPPHHHLHYHHHEAKTSSSSNMMPSQQQQQHQPSHGAPPPAPHHPRHPPPHHYPYPHPPPHHHHPHHMYPPPPHHHYPYPHPPPTTAAPVHPTAPSPPPPPLDINFEELIAESSLVSIQDRDLVPDSLFLAMAQMKPCQLTQGDRVGCYKARDLGFMGMCCKHCGGQPGFGRFFPNSVRSLAQTTTSQTMLKHVGAKCRVCPDHVRNAIVALQDHATATSAANAGKESGRPRYGSRKIFFQRVWTRLHNGPEATSTEVKVEELDTVAKPREEEKRPTAVKQEDEAAPVMQQQHNDSGRKRRARSSMEGTKRSRGEEAVGTSRVEAV